MQVDIIEKDAGGRSMGEALPIVPPEPPIDVAYLGTQLLQLGCRVVSIFELHHAV